MLDLPKLQKDMLQVRDLKLGSFGPTTAGRMDSYVGPFMKEGGSFVSLAKGNRSKAVT